MRRIGWQVVIVVAACAGAILLAAARASAAGVRARLAPSRVAQNSRITLSYLVNVRERLRTLSRTRKIRSAYVVELRGHAARQPSACDSSASREPSSDATIRRGHALTDTFEPGSAGGPEAWCAGAWRGRILYRRDRCELDDLGLFSCTPQRGGARVVARFGFRVTRRFEHQCRVRNSATVLSTAHVRLYEPDDGSSSLWGCLKQVGRRVELATDVNGIDGYYDRPRLSGDYVALGAYEGSPCARYMMCPPGYQPNVFTEVVNLRTGDTHRSPGSTPAAGRAGSALVLTERGAIAWITCESPSCASAAVRAYDRTGERVLDTGPGIQPASLRRMGATVSWVHGGGVHAAALTGQGP
jgi:hypothetical protein